MPVKLLAVLEKRTTVIKVHLSSYLDCKVLVPRLVSFKKLRWNYIGLDFIEKKSGHQMGRDTNEKITDGARNLYEKATG